VPRTVQTSLALCALLLAVLGMMAPGISQAGVYKCSSHTILERDYVALRHAAQRAAGTHVLDWQQLSVCMNPGGGRAWLVAQHEPLPDGSTNHFHLLCTRDARPWACEPTIQRWLEGELILGDRQQAYSVEIPDKLPVGDAHRLMVRAFALASSLGMDTSCGNGAASPGLQDSLQREREAAWVKALQDAFSPKAEALSGSIQELDGSIYVTIDLEYLQFSGTPQEADQKRFECWGEWIVVT